MDQRVLRRFGLVERMEVYRVAIRVSIAEVSLSRVRGRPRFGWMDTMKFSLDNREMAMEAARKYAKDGKE